MREYQNIGVTNSIKVIIHEVQQLGKSQGWKGDMHQFLIVREELKKQNIKYNYLGQWVH